MKHSQAFGQPAALREPGVLGLASTLVKAEPQYQDLVEYLLGRVVVADHIDHAIALAKKFRYSLRIVTLDGELLSAGGSMTGGAFKNSSNLLGRRREIEELEAQCKKALVKVDSIQKDLVLNEGILEEARENLVLVKEDIQKSRISENTIRIKMRQLEEKRQEIAESATDLVLENEELEEQLKELRGNREQLLSEAGQLERLGEEKEEETRRAAAVLERLKTEREQCAANLSEVQLSASRIRQRDSFIGENIRRVSEEETALLDERAQLEQGSTGSGETIAVREAQIVSLREEIQKETEQTEVLETAMQELLQKKEEQAGRQKGFFDKKEELSQRMNLLDRDLLRLQNQREKLSERLEASVQYMWNEYELTYSSAEKLQDPELTSVPEMKKTIEGLKTQIRNLGHVNVNSIEDYKEVSERYEFMKTQHDDLAAAEAALLKIIDELDTGMRRQFEEKFKEIREEFDKVFKELFGGGHGTLELSQEEDILEAGIQIISQPPGKKLQNMMQLSGGEKALTAIALLFAIQNLKPSPFCLLDEIEAALDDSNVDRFAGYLHKLTKYTQFIVITHRRGTMVAADRLYGITMQEKGVSTLVSVSLIEAELDK